MSTAPPDTEPLPAHVEETIRSIALLHAKHHMDVTSAQRYVDQATALAGQPAFLLVLGCGVGIWAASNAIAPLVGFHAIDPAPFAWLELALSLTALVMTVLILVTQRSADKLGEMRGQMTLELTLMTEQKVAKIIELVEELRKDSPHVRDRIDTEAHEMSTRADPHAVLGAIKEIDEEMCAAIKEDSTTTRGS
jgi:uncharacterized membrane protein